MVINDRNRLHCKINIRRVHIYKMTTTIRMTQPTHEKLRHYMDSHGAEIRHAAGKSTFQGITYDDAIMYMIYKLGGL